MGYLKALLFGSIGLGIAFILRVVWWFVAGVPHGNTGLTAYAGYTFWRDPLFQIMAVLCVGLGLYLGRP
jgi:hypothetical protein